jgi:hypothetical protein
MRKRTSLSGVAVAVVAALVAAVAAWAGNPHFLRIGQPTLAEGQGVAARSSGGGGTAPASDPRVFVPDIVVAGVQDGVVTSLDAPFQAVYVCVKSGGAVPNPANHAVLGGNASATFPAARNGKATGSLLTGPLPSAAEAAAATGFSCPKLQVLEFDRVVFFGLVLSVDGGESVPLDVTLASGSAHGLAG